MHNYNDRADRGTSTRSTSGTAFLPSPQDPTIAASAIPGATSFAATNPDLVRAYRGYSSMAAPAGFTRAGGRSTRSSSRCNRRFRDGLQFGFSDTIAVGHRQRRAAIRPRRGRAVRPSGRSGPGAGAPRQPVPGNAAPHRSAHVMKASAVWDLPDIKQQQHRLEGARARRQRLAALGDLDGRDGRAYTVGFSYQNGGANVNLTGSPDFGARIRIVGDPGKGCSSDPYRQFNTAAFQGPLVGSVGARVRQRLSVRLLLERARPVDRAQHPTGRRPGSAAARRHVQCAEQAQHHRAATRA